MLVFEDHLYLKCPPLNIRGRPQPWEDVTWTLENPSTLSHRVSLESVVKAKHSILVDGHILKNNERVVEVADICDFNMEGYSIPHVKYVSHIIRMLI